MKAHVIPVDFDVAYVTDLLNGSEGFAGDAFPGGRSPILELHWNGGIVGFKFRRKVCERA